MKPQIIWVKACILVLFAISFSWICSSAPVDKVKALHVAELFLADNNPVLLSPSNETDGFYVFCRKNNQGFVIISDDDRMLPIIGYSDRGTIELDNIPDNLKYWLDGFKEESRRVKLNLTEASVMVKSQWAQLEGNASNTMSFANEVLLNTADWDQGDPYNRLCPEINGGRSVTGCVATAMAIVMYYHRWPIAGKGTLPGYSYRLGMSTIYIDGYPLGTEYQWDSMLSSYSSGAFNQKQAEAVAQLMKDCGHMVKMQYSPSSSGAYSEDIWPAMEQYMSFTGGTFLRRRDYSSTEWDNMLKQSLDKALPVIYTGVSSQGGHAFVVDGYDSNGLFHINWGWGGRSNGYFRCPNFDDFTRDHDAIFNITPSASVSSELILIQDGTHNGLWCSQDTFEKGDTFKVGYAVKNKSGVESENILSIGVFNSSGTYIEPASGNVDMTLYGGSSHAGTITCTLNCEPLVGYRLMLCALKNDDWVPVLPEKDSDVRSYILIAEEYYLEEVTSVRYSITEKKLTISTIPDIQYDFLSESGIPISTGSSDSEGVIILSVKELGKGVYTLVLSKGNDNKSVKVVL